MTNSTLFPPCKRLSFSRLALLAAASLPAAAAAGEDRWTLAREEMVRDEIIGGGVANVRVQQAMRATARHEFLPPAKRHLAYLDMGLPIGGGQTITAPLVVARMTEALNPQPKDRVLEIGTGSGYQAAVLSPLVSEVYSIEIVESLARRAKRTLRRLGYDNIHTKLGDGFQGWPEHAPFDKIIVTCSPASIPPPLVEQLTEGGRMVIPLGERYQQTLYILTKTAGKMESVAIEPTFFVPMTGQAEQERDQKIDIDLPQVVNGSFEEPTDQSELPGWYYVRQSEVVADSRAPHDEHFVRFGNQNPGRGAQALQALGMDGRRVKRVEVSAWVAGKNLQQGENAGQTPRIEITFYNQGRAPIESEMLGPWQGTFDWKREQAFIRVPNRSRLSVLAVSMYGGVGELSVDQVGVRIVDVDTLD